MIPSILAESGLTPVGIQSAVPPADGLRRAMRTIERFERALGRKALWARRRAEERRRSRTRQRLRAEAEDLSARAAGGQRLLRPRKDRSPVRLFPGEGFERLRHARIGHFRRRLARYRGPRNDARPARRTASALFGADEPRHGGLSRSLRRHRRPVPAFRHARVAHPADPQSKRLDCRYRQKARAIRATIRGGDWHAWSLAPVCRRGRVLDACAERRYDRAAPTRGGPRLRGFWGVPDHLRVAVRGPHPPGDERLGHPAERRDLGRSREPPRERGGEDGRACSQHVHPRARLLPAGQPRIRRLPARDHHGGP